MSTVITICYAGLVLSGLLCVIRLAVSRSVADRVLALDTFLIVVVVGIAVRAAQTGNGVYLNALLAVALVAFIGTTAVGRFIVQRGER